MRVFLRDKCNFIPIFGLKVYEAMNAKKIKLENVKDRFRLSIRSYNVCKNNGIDDLSGLINYYDEHRNFMELKNCGQITNFELEKVCEYYCPHLVRKRYY